MKLSLKFLPVLALSLGLVACGSDSDDPPPPPSTPAEPNTIVDVAVDNGNFTTLVAALEATGLDATLDDEDATFTVFAPTDDAFALLGEDTINSLLADTDTLSDILLYHVIADAEVDSSAAVDSAGSTVQMANGKSTGLSLSGDSLMVNLSTVTMTDIETDNGIIHVIDAVLMPPADRGEPSMNIVETAVDNGNFTTLVAALQAAELDTVLADESETYTVFAPTDAAFDMVGEEVLNLLLADTEALSSLLLQHVISGAEVNSINAYAANGTSVTTASGAEIPVSIMDGKLRIGGAEVVMSDIYTTNGVIHVIDTVIVEDLELPSPPKSIVDVAVEAGSFTTLVAALEATGLDTVLADMDGSFTVFAPTDDAFAELGEETINNLLADTDTLSDILLYHVISGSEVLADAAVNLAAGEDSLVEMANGDNAGLSLSGEQLYINLSQVTSANVMASNGVIHVVDKVMMPPADMGTPTDNIVETAIANGNFTTLVSALQAAGLEATLADEDETFTVFAPTDAAFEKIDEAVLNDLIADVPTLTEVLLQHVVSGAAVNSTTAFTLNGSMVETAGGDNVSVEIVDGMLQINGSTVTMYDIYTTNGVIHVIDTVITTALE